jgi:hypothetical protein
MTLYQKKIPVLKDGVAKKAMQLLLKHVKAHRGLTKSIEDYGINGKWLKVDGPMDIGVSKFFKILACKAHFQSDEEFIAEWNKAGMKFLQWVRKNEGMKE